MWLLENRMNNTFERLAFSYWGMKRFYRCMPSIRYEDHEIGFVGLDDCTDRTLRGHFPALQILTVEDNQGIIGI